MARRTGQLHHRARLSRYRERGILEFLAKRPSYRRERYIALSCCLLAGLSDGGGPRAATPGLRARLVDNRRRENVEIPRQRHPAGPARREIRGRSGALFPTARTAVRQRRRFF